MKRKNKTVSRICIYCDRKFQGREDAKTCSNRCRMAYSRLEDKREEAKQTWLYKAFDKTGILLYIGVTANPSQRMWNHKYNSIWWEEKGYITWQRFENRKEAESAEHLSINEDVPVFNKRCNKGCCTK